MTYQTRKPYSQVGSSFRSGSSNDEIMNWVLGILGDDDLTTERDGDEWVLVDEAALDIIKRLAQYSRKFPAKLYPFDQ